MGSNFSDQKYMRKIEALCTQEDPTACSAGCPLHMDVKSFIRHIAGEDWAAAFQLFNKTVPFVQIVAHACDAPCQGGCRRAEIGGEIQIRKLELAVLKHAAVKPKKPLFLPRKKQKIAIIGGSLRGLTAAFDLARKGYQVTIYEASAQLGGHLWDFQRKVLPAEAIEADLEALLQFPINVLYHETIACDNETEIKMFIESNNFDAVFLACAARFASLADENQLTPLAQVVAGRRGGRLTTGASPIYDIFDGRSAATAIDRIMQGASVTAGREKEGSQHTKLYTNLTEYACEMPVLQGDEPYQDEQVITEAKRCIQCECLECVKQCAFMQQYKSYPRRYVREVYNNLSIAMGNHHANGMINTCSLCGQCASICPNGLNLADVFLAARRQMVTSEKMPPSAHEFALLDMEYSMSDAYFTARHQPGTQTSQYLFFPGCQLGASEPDLVECVYSDLSGRLPGGVGLMLGCCGVMAHWAGREEDFHAVLDVIRTHWHALGNPEIIAACPSCLTTLRDLAGLPVIGIWDILEDFGLPARSGAGNDPGTLAVHDACSVRYDPHIQQGVRSLAGKMGYTLEELTPARQTTPCCGYGGLVPFVKPEIADSITEQRIQNLAAQKTAADGLLTYCVNCRDRYLAQGTVAYHLLELIYGPSNVRRKPPTWSQRQENRTALKRSLLLNMWGETMEEEQGITLYIYEKLEPLLETRMILRSDIQKTIMHAEQEEARLLNRSTNHYFASCRPQNVTFWVEYTPCEDGGFIVYNAYSHRMDAEALNRPLKGG